VHEDWGVRAERWRGIRSDVVTVRGTEVHVLRADGPADGPVQLLVHGLGGSATNWIEVISGLAEHGPVIAPDLPGFGRTRPPHPSGSRIRANLGFLRAFVADLGIDRVTVHGNSMGGLLSVLLAEAEPAVVERLVLVSPALPGPRTQLYRLTPQTLLTFAPFAVPGLGHRVLGRLYASRTAEQLFDENQRYIHGDPSRIRPELRQIGLENIAYGQRTSWRLDGFVAAAESLVLALLAAGPLWRSVAAVQAPTLLAWGEYDKLVGRQVIDGVVARRADWELHVFEDVGHAAMVEVPDRYLDLVAGWYARSSDAADAA
jgi:pimeloyl-ACP methyl ester carboxylesterase